ncbi:MAG TPA: alpha/beta hydrolase [Chloroflexia bacterium]|nr:alpha/beta hydrolase [Chloroflexia bacterium]
MVGVFRKLRTGAKLRKMAQHIFSTPAPSADVRMPYGDGPFHFGDLRLPRTSEAGPHPVVVVIHGGFWRARYDLEHIGHACAALTSQGVATWNIEYRRTGNEGGGWPGTFHDVGAAVDHLRVLAPEHNLDLERVVVIGHSAGGHLALWAAGRHRIPEGDPLYSPDPLPVKAAVALAGVIDLNMSSEMKLSNGATEEFMGGAPQEMPERYAAASPREMLPLGVPHALIHGTDDENVPYEIGEKYHAAALAAGDQVKLVPLPHAGHFEVIDPKMPEWKWVVEMVMGYMTKDDGRRTMDDGRRTTDDRR